MTPQVTAKPRGRPRAYDPDVALEQAMQTFWKSGYCGTSLDDLSAAMHMNRPSLYAGFGDKRRLYILPEPGTAALCPGTGTPA